MAHHYEWNSLSRSQTACSRPRESAIPAVARFEKFLRVYITLRARITFKSTARKDDDITRVIPEKERRILSTLSKICPDTPGEGTYYITVTAYMRQFWPLLGLWKFGLVSTPVCEETYENVVLRPLLFIKIWQMFTFYPPFGPFVAFWINGRGWASL